MPHILSNHAVLLGAGNNQGYAAGDNINITDYVISGKDWTSEIESAVSGKQDKFTLGSNLTWYSGTVLDVNNKDCVTVPNAVALGLSASALSDYSFTNGRLTVANGNNSHAEGRETSALGQYSHSEGQWTVAAGDGSIAAGNGVSAIGWGQVVLGSYNLPNASHILQIGCGVGDIGDQRKNAIEVRGDASVWYRYNDDMYRMRPYSAGDGITINDYVIASHPSVPKHGGWVYAGDIGSVSYTAMAGDTFQIQFEKEEGNYLGNIKVYNSSETRFMHAIVNYGTPISISELQTETVLTGITDYGIARLDIVGMGVGNEIPRCSFTITYNVTNGGLYYTVYDEYLY